MSRELSATLTTEVGREVTTPGYLLSIGFASGTRYLSTRGNVTFRGNLYLSRHFTVSGMMVDAADVSLDGSVTIVDADNSYGTLILADGVADRPIQLWKFYGDAASLGYHDATPILVGVGDEGTLNVDDGTVTITLMQAGGVTMKSPRRFITRESGFSVVPPAGTIISWAGQQFRLERGD